MFRPNTPFRNRSLIVETPVMYEVHTDYQNNQPTTITFRPILRADQWQYYADDAVYATLAALIRHRLIHVEGQLTPWADDPLAILRNVRGWLLGANLADPNQRYGTPLLRLEEITAETFSNILEQIHQSNADLRIYDLEWTLVLDRHAFIVAQSPFATKPAWAPAKYVETWKGHKTINGDRVNCIAFALAFFMYLERYSSKNLTRDLQQIAQNAYHLMLQLGIPLKSNLYPLQKFVDHYPEYRVAIIRPKVKRCDTFCWVGKNFKDEKKRIYLLLDQEQDHMALCFRPAPITGYRSFCHECLVGYNETCDCQTDEKLVEAEQKRVAKRQKLRNTQCIRCGLYGQHTCASAQCQTCNAFFTRGYDRSQGQGHRCLVLNKSKRQWLQGEPGAPPDKPLEPHYRLWAYDLESCIVRSNELTTLEFAQENGQFVLDENQQVVVSTIKKGKHKANLVVARDVFTREERIWSRDDDNDNDDVLRRFIVDMRGINLGRNICVAHNGSSYDSRLVLEEIFNYDPHPDVCTIARGCKFTQISYGERGTENDTRRDGSRKSCTQAKYKTIFRDSMHFLKGSLASLAKDFLGATMRKGHFPHLFNTEDHYDYEGPIPGLEYFDLAFMAKSPDQAQEFLDWHSNYQGVWNFKHELKEYCRNDVAILAEVMRTFHDQLAERLDGSPWLCSTIPAYTHKAIIRKVTNELELPPQNEEEAYHEAIQDYAWNKSWGALTSNEYWFTRLALRGGRTDIRKVYHHVSDEDWARGIRIRYQDIVSMYPYVQVAFDYPVGLPIIEVYDLDFFPCVVHRSPIEGNVVELRCECSLQKKQRYKQQCREDIRIIPVPPTAAEILADDTFFGFACVTLVPPKNLFHPVLVVWDKEQGKSVAVLERIECATFVSVELKKALEQGYVLEKIHRFQRFKKAPGLWNDFIKDLYIDKMANAGPAPSLEEQDRLVHEFEERFGMGDAVRASFPFWGDNPAKKQTAKIMLNSGWGKHCERPNMPQTLVFTERDTDKYLDLCKNAQEKVMHIQNITMIKSNMYLTMSGLENRQYDFHDAYLPAGCFVPAYGRMMLWDQLNKLGDRVLMHDTDSIVYIYDPEKYNIPEGNIWGDWEVEKIDYKNGGIRTFVGLAPKSYGIKTGNGKTMIKVKGLSLKAAHEPLFNFNTMETMVKDYLDHQKLYSIKLPQFSFGFDIKQGMYTNNFLKNVAFRPEYLKGQLRGATLYPPGHE